MAFGSDAQPLRFEPLPKGLIELQAGSALKEVDLSDFALNIRRISNSRAQKTLCPNPRISVLKLLLVSKKSGRSAAW